ncbi:MAG: response regulator [Elusimicrobia bacterium]|nr:response regulator [Elusimicrobiota bacterium]
MNLKVESLAVLIVDRDERDRAELQGRLQAAPGWSLTIGQAADFAAATTALKERSYDLVFLARRLPEGECLPLLDRVRQLHPKSAVIVTSAEPDTAWAVSAMKKGALDCLVRGDLPRTDFGPILSRLVETRNLVNQNMELRQVNQMKNEFIANVSHELRAPLTVILGYAHSLQDGTLGDLTAEQRKAAESIAARSRELLATLNQILRARETLEGRQLATLKPTDLRELWRDCAQRAAKDLERKELRLELALPQSPVWVMADAAAFVEVCANLFSNAIKFSPKGGLIRLAVGASEGRAWMMLEDQGPGIPPELLPHIFEDFATAATRGPTRRRTGLGLGLAISRQTVELHGGSIWLESPQPGQGCTAHVDLPLTQPEAPETVVAQAAPVEKKRVLIVEDNPDIIEIIKLFVAAISDNLELAMANSGFEALESIQNQVPHLIILDIMMPGMSGLELLDRLRRVPESSRIPVLVLTGYVDAAQRARDAGAQEVLVKPFDRKVFVAKVLELLQKADTAH